MTLPQARFLLREMDAADGHRDSARMTVEGLVDIACAAGLVKRSGQTTRPSDHDTSANRSPANSSSSNDAGVLIPELRAVMESQMKSEGWQPPASAAPSV